VSDAPIEIVIVDDHQIVIDGIRQLLRSEPRVSVVGTAVSLAEAGVLGKRVSPDVVILDLKLPDSVQMSAIPTAREHFPKAKILVLTGFGEKVRAAAMAQGADAFLTKELASDQLINEVLSLAGHKAQSSRAVEVLSRREREVARLAAEGYTNEEIAESLSLSVNTVKTHMAAVLSKLGLRDRVALAAQWDRLRTQIE
jgi:DNA-binding NarL/FixJ family response regulator